MWTQQRNGVTENEDASEQLKKNCPLILFYTILGVFRLL